nr:guanine nucleotide-binding protein G(f) subunit alpha [Leptinotarsa decemlineata]
MGCGKKKIKNVDNEHVLYTKKFLNTKKLLLLGTGESGKTTIIKQMKILHINGFSESEKKEKIVQIKQNIHESIYDIVNNMSKIDPPVEPESEDAKKSIEFILQIGEKEPTEYSDEYFEHIKVAWADVGVQKAFRRSNEYQLIDSAEHFLNNIDTIKRSDYIPSLQDILFCRVMTTSVSKIEFDVPIPKKYGGGTAEFWMFDVGGQRGERKKWIKVFAGIQAILFLIAASDFDLTLRENKKINRLEESFELFRDIYSSEYVLDAGLIVFLNKQDILKKKIEQGIKLEKYFPEFSLYSPDGKLKCSDEYQRAKLFMKYKIDELTKIPVEIESIGPLGENITEIIPPRNVYTHFTIATDTNNIRKVFDSVHSIILENVLKEALPI